MTKVTITQSEYDKIKRDISKLKALEAGGVDNWEWYDESLSEWRKENELFDLADEFVDNMNDVAIEAEVDYPAGREAGASIILPEEQVKSLFLEFIKKYKEIHKETK